MPQLTARPHWAEYSYEVPGIASHLHRVWGKNLASFAVILDRLVSPTECSSTRHSKGSLHHHDEPVHTE
jgi:hypothetical protein